MTKREELNALVHGEGCLAHSAEDEPVFILVARDKASSEAIHAWTAAAVRRGVPVSSPKITNAWRIADDMERWRQLHGGGKLPD